MNLYDINYVIGCDFGTVDKTVYSVRHIATGIICHASTEDEAKRLCREEILKHMNR